MSYNICSSGNPSILGKLYNMCSTGNPSTLGKFTGAGWVVYQCLVTRIVIDLKNICSVKRLNFLLSILEMLRLKKVRIHN